MTLIAILPNSNSVIFSKIVVKNLILNVSISNNRKVFIIYSYGDINSCTINIKRDPNLFKTLLHSINSLIWAILCSIWHDLIPPKLHYVWFRNHTYLKIIKTNT